METILIGMIAGFTATVILSGMMLIKDTMGLVRVDMIGMLRGDDDMGPRRPARMPSG